MNELKKSGEDYLETIYNLSKQGGTVKSVDVAMALKVTKPSTHRAIENLVKKGLANKETYGQVSLTSEGERLAKEITKKHKAVTMLLTKVLGVSEEIAEVDACKIEHELSEETTKRLYEFLEIE
ncbi:MAG: metal-dependent transcriptional regulator [Firmicutes bacterium]|nr:metal-dependent transcriptional regulator [Bacillota bacterium]MCL2255557.1 metal-dependent transcriptional regulator [Bacillota bacterium]